ncbi:PREDICTED: uncharacterized protein LOC108775341 [Cyphomyrmex costatus]|uniref:uncharacterized protein LOC108775341 n=1 Tax=Cyphomyrmex costatus TaxID=456900 RepID=UPI000852366A|nr:PREDICTED: uncharacterized protein LOC108775341 [Cyphomyrmex costatus]
MRPYSSYNKGRHYILTVIDVLSKYAWTVPLKSKGGSETVNAIAEIIRENGNITQMRNIRKDGLIYHVKTKHNNDERFKSNKDLYTGGVSYKCGTCNKAIAERLLDTVYSAIKIAGPAKFKVGDAVRVSKYKTIFEKGYTPNWTTEVFQIVKIQKTNPVTYLLEDYRGKPVAGGFYEHELRRVANPDVYLVEKVLRKKGDKVYVKWLGFDGSHNSWINKNDVV